jgi:hypothetical protein
MIATANGAGRFPNVSQAITETDSASEASFSRVTQVFRRSAALR